MSDILNLSAGGAASSGHAATVKGLPSEVNGLPAFYYWRQSIRDGRYIHPKHGFTIDVSPERRSKWEQNFRRMKEEGVTVPIMAGHTSDPAKKLGNVVDVRQNGPWLEELHQYLGQEQRDIALRNEISLGIDLEVKTGKGTVLDEAVVHSAVVTDPVIPSQGTAVAASRGASHSLFMLAAEGAKMPYQLTDEQFAKVKPLLGDGITPENFAEKLTGVLTAGQTATQNLSRTAGELETAKGKIIELSRGTAKPDPEALAARAETAEDRIGLAVEAGDIPAELAPELKNRLNVNGQPSAFMLSNSADLGNVSPINFVLSLFKGKQLGKKITGPRTGVQLSRDVPGDNQPAKFDAEYVKQRAAAVSVGK